MGRPRILIVGASTRAAAFSAIRAGFDPVCCDMFGDEDLRAFAEWIPVVRYPEDIPQAVSHLPSMPFFYTGALENHPDVIAALEKKFELWGTPAEVLPIVRDYRFPLGESRMVRPWDSPPAADGSWVLKPIKSAGGLGIHVWNSQTKDEVTPNPSHYFQKYWRARSIGLSMVVSDEASGHFARDFARSLPRGFAGNPFGYSGSIVQSAPRDVARRTRALCVFCWQAGVRGLLGIDVVESVPDAIELLEINPRYTASMECIEWSKDRLFVSELRDVFNGPATEAKVIQRGALCAKRIIYADCDLKTPDLAALFEVGTPDKLGWINDIPAPGTHIERGQPICTVFAWESHQTTCLSTLDARVSEVRAVLE